MTTVTGPGERLSDVDTLVWTMEQDPRLRSTILAVAVLDGPLDRRDLRHRIERASRAIPRLRHRVTPDPAGIGAPRWELDPGFVLAFHLRRANLGGRGTREDLHALVADIGAQPFDRSRPLWEFTHVEGLVGGEQALVLKTHHAITDGVGGVELALEIFDLEPVPDPTRSDLPPLPDPPPPRRGTARRGRRGLEAALLAEATAALGGVRAAIDAAAHATEDPVSAAYRLGAVLGSATRLLRPGGGPPSTTLVERSHEVGFDAFSVPLDDLRTAGRRVDGTVNDAFVTAVTLGMRRYHRRHGDPLPTLRIAVPINRRDGSESATGNHWAPGRLHLDIQSDEPDELMRAVQERMRRLRREHAHDLLGPLAGVLRRIPPNVTTSVVASVTAGIDVTASNVPGSPIPLHLLGRQVVELVPFGPLSGGASNVTLLSHGDRAHIGVARDLAAIPDGEAFVADLRDGFARVLG